MVPKWERLLSITGAVAGVMSFLSLITFRPFYVIIFLAALAVGFFIYKFWKLPSFTILGIVHRITIHDIQGKYATKEKEVKIRPNWRGLNEYAFRGIAADGEPRNWKIDIGTIDRVVISAHKYTVFQKFDGPLKPFRSFRTTLTYELVDSYLKEKEMSGYECVYRTNYYRCEINFPEDRPATAARAYCLELGDPIKLHDPNLISGGQKITWESKHLQRGSLYWVEWDW